MLPTCRTLIFLSGTPHPPPSNRRPDDEDTRNGGAWRDQKNTTKAHVRSPASFVVAGEYYFLPAPESSLFTRYTADPLSGNYVRTTATAAATRHPTVGEPSPENINTSSLTKRPSEKKPLHLHRRGGRVLAGCGYTFDHRVSALLRPCTPGLIILIKI